MSVKIRLSRIGKKKVPFYRIIVVDSRKKRDGACIADCGTYDALKSKLITYDEELINKWLALGAEPTETVERLMRLYRTVGIGVSEPPKTKKATKKTTPKAEKTAKEKPVEPAVEKPAEVSAEAKAEEPAEKPAA